MVTWQSRRLFGICICMKAEWGGSDASDEADGGSVWAGFAKPLELLPLHNRRLRPSSAPQVCCSACAAATPSELDTHLHAAHDNLLSSCSCSAR